MCGAEKLAQIHHRLDEIFPQKKSNKAFGNKNILVIGDLLQVNNHFFILYEIERIYFHLKKIL
jgi:hypothetical protein